MCLIFKQGIFSRVKDNRTHVKYCCSWQQLSNTEFCTIKYDPRGSAPRIIFFQVVMTVVEAGVTLVALTGMTVVVAGLTWVAPTGMTVVYVGVTWVALTDMTVVVAGVTPI